MTVVLVTEHDVILKGRLHLPTCPLQTNSLIECKPLCPLHAQGATHTIQEGGGGHRKMQTITRGGGGGKDKPKNNNNQINKKK